MPISGYGSQTISYDDYGTVTQNIKWLGVRPTDIKKYEIPKSCRVIEDDNTKILFRGIAAGVYQA